jgi:hypothetical protein
VAIFDEKAPPGKQFTRLGAADGVVNTPSSSAAFIKTKAGEIYWGGANGVYRFYPEINHTNLHASGPLTDSGSSITL